MNTKKMTGIVEKIVNGGFGLVRSEEGVVMLKYVIPGEKVVYRIRERSKGILWGKVEKIISTCGERIIPECIYYGECGGCIFSHMKYEDQIDIKKDILTDDLTRIGQLNIKIDNVYRSPEFHYRARAKLKGLRNGKIGFIKRGTNEVMEIEHCKIVDHSINNFIKRWNSKNTPPFFHQLDVFNNPGTGITFVNLSAPPGEGDQEFLNSFSDTVFTWKGNRGNGISTLIVGEFKFMVSAEIFFQVNRFQWMPMIRITESMMKRSDTSVDMYTGSGFFIPSLMKFSKKVIGIENNHAAVKLAEFSFPAVKFLRSPVEKAVLPVAEQVLVDPPRSGIPLKVKDHISGTGTKNIIYVSCSTSTLSRDLKYFISNGYKVVQLNMIDLFPQTSHIEVIASLKLE